MKVLSVSHLFPNRFSPNYGIFVKERVKAVSENIDSKIIAPLPYFPMIGFFERYKGINRIERIEKFDNVFVHYPRHIVIPKYFKFIDGYLYYLSMNAFFSRMIKDYHIDLLDLHWVYPDAYAGLKWAKRFKKKIIVTVRGDKSICYFERSIRKRLLIKTLRSVDHIIAVSTDLRNKVVSEYGVDDNCVTVIPNGIDTRNFFLIDKKEALKLCGLERGKRYILSLSRLSKEKGLEYLFRAFSFLNCTDLILLVAGSGPLKGELFKLASDLNISNNVRFIGEVDHNEAYKWYNAADVFCLPSIGEGCPNVIIEALACGTPIVSTRVGGIPDLVISQDYGLLVQPSDAISLSRALEIGLGKDWNRFNIAEHGARNTWGQVADRVINIYEKVVS